VLVAGRDRCAYRGRWRTAEAEKLQIVKQPDVLLALHLLPELGDAACLGRHLDYYEPLTTHESSISPGMHALFAARAGRPALGLDYLRKAMTLDCANSSDAGSGIHAANLGAIWQAVVNGFAGVSVSAQGISLEPHLPRHWSALSLLAGWRSSRLRLHITHHEVIAALEQGEQPVRLVVEGHAAWVVPGQAHLFPRRAAAPALAGQDLALAGE
jgi:trehalose/maltose hydrolase-like predicted phosphorylase